MFSLILNIQRLLFWLESALFQFSISLLKYFFRFYLNMWVSLYVCMLFKCRYICRPEKGVEFSGARVAISCKTSWYVCWELSLSLLGQELYLTTEPSFQLLSFSMSFGLFSSYGLMVRVGVFVLSGTLNGALNPKALCKHVLCHWNPFTAATSKFLDKKIPLQDTKTLYG